MKHIHTFESFTAESNKYDDLEWKAFGTSNRSFKKQSNGKWLEVSGSHLLPNKHGIEKYLGLTKKEHEEKLKELEGEMIVGQKC